MVHKKVKSQKRRQSKAHRRSRHRSRSQKGGDWYNPFSWFGSESSVPGEEKGMVNRIGESITSGIQKVDDSLASASTSITEGANNVVNKTTELLNTDVSLTTPGTQASASTYPTSEPVTTYQTESITTSPSGVIGGKRYKRSRSRRQRKSRSKSRYLARKGGKGLGLTYYATPVNDIKIAEPTYLLNYEGGRKRKTAKK